MLALSSSTIYNATIIVNSQFPIVPRSSLAIDDMKELEPPTSLPVCLAILILRTLLCEQELVSVMLHCRKLTVVEVEQWFTEIPFLHAQRLCADFDLRQKSDKLIAGIEDLDVGMAMKVGKIIGEDILLHYRSIGYLESKAEKEEQTDPALVKAKEQHFNNLAQLARLLAYRISILMDDVKEEWVAEGNIVDGLRRSWPVLDKGEPRIDGIGIGEPMEAGSTADLLHHFNQLYPEFKIKSWKKLTRTSRNLKKIGDKLQLLARSKAFKPCTKCEVCKVIKLI